MARTIEEILGYVTLTGQIEEVKTGIPWRLPEGYRTITRNVVGDSGRYTLFRGTRRTARRVEFDAPSKRRELVEIGTRDVKLWHSRENIQLPVSTYMNLRAYDSYERQELGRQEVDRQIFQLKAVFENAQTALVNSALAKGFIWFDAGGNLLPDSTGATLTIDYLIPAENKNQLNGIIGDSWALATTDIPADIRQIRKTALQQSGYPITTVLYGENLPSYLLKNDFIQPFWARHEEFRNELLRTNEIPNGLLGLNWVPVYETFYEDADGVVREFFDPDAAVFVPDVDITWYEMMVGSAPIPTNFQPIQNPGGLSQGATLHQGLGSYAVFVNDPVTANIYAVDTRLPIIKVNNVVFIADVTP